MEIAKNLPKLVAWLFLLQLISEASALRRINLEERGFNASMSSSQGLVYLSFNGREYMAVPDQGRIVIWNIQQDKAERVFQMDRNVYFLASRPGKRYLFAADYFGGVSIFEIEKFTRVADYRNVSSIKIEQIEIFADDSEQFLLNARDRHLFTCGVRAGCDKTYILEKDRYNILKIAGSGRTLVASTWQNTIRVIPPDANPFEENGKELNFLSEKGLFRSIQELNDRLFILQDNGEITELSLPAGERKNIYPVGTDIRKIFPLEEKPGVLLMEGGKNKIFRLTLATKQTSFLFQETQEDTSIEQMQGALFLSGRGIWNVATGQLEKSFSLIKKHAAADNVYFK